MNEIRQINQCIHRFSKDMKCTKCGQFNYKNQSIKTSKYTTPFHFNMKHYLASLRRSSTKVIDTKQLSQDTYLLLSSICEKFMFTRETLALGLYIYQFLHKVNCNQKFWASAALIVAGKAIELDKNVPYLNRYQRYADKAFTQQEYQQAQRTIFETMNFQVQFSTFITFLDFYLTCGVVFKQDTINNTLIEFFQDDVMIRARQFLKRGTFTKYDPEMLALGIIKEIRLKYNLKGWNEHLEILTEYGDSQVFVIGSTESPLKQISHNGYQKMSDLKGISIRSKFQGIIKNDRSLFQKPLLDKYTSYIKAPLKQNTFTTKALLTSTRKPVGNYFMDNYTSINSELVSKRR